MSVRTIRPASKEAYQLLHEGTLALAELERVGLRIDVPLLEKTTEKVVKKINRVKERMKEDKHFKIWKNSFGDKTKLTADDQMRDLVYEKLGFPVKHLTDKGKPSVDQHALEAIDLPIVQDFVKLKKLVKTKTTYLDGISRELVGDTVHQNYNLNIASSYRSTCNDPNGQNFPVRDEWMHRMVRSLIIPWEDFQLGEWDFKGIEVGIAACYNKDPVLIKYVKDKTKDMHRDMAALVYMLKNAPPEYWKDKTPGMGGDVRYCAKNKFVFPEFYGSFYILCADALYEAIERMHLKAPDGTPLKDHLRKHGIRKLGKLDPELRARPGTFEAHVKSVEDYFWGEMFRVYTQWKEAWYARYRSRGWFQFFTGFVCHGLFNRKQVINYPIQGSAFHCLLWCLIRVVRWLQKKKMQSRLNAQIHDSMIGHIHPKERDDVIEKIHRVMTEDLPRHWDWIIVPLEVEVEMSPVNGSWYEKEKLAA